MVDKIIELENNKKYLILDETNLNDIKYYYGLRLDENENPSNNYLFFEEINEDDNILLNIIQDNDIKDILLTAFTINYIEKVYDEV